MTYVSSTARELIIRYYGVCRLENSILQPIEGLPAYLRLKLSKGEKIRVFSFISRVLGRFFSFILIIFTAILILLSIFIPSALYSSLVVLFMVFFILPISWFKYEFEVRLFMFLLAEASLVVLFVVNKISYVYIAAITFTVAVFIFLLLGRFKWHVSEFMGTEDTLIITVLLMASITILISVTQLGSQENLIETIRNLIMISGFFATVFMLNYLCITLRRTELVKFLDRLGGFKKPEDFIEKILKKSIKLEDEKKDFIRYRFSEFLKYVERGAFEQAYVTFATGTLELLGIWYGNIQKRTLKEWHICYKDDKGMVKEEKVQHDDIRGAIVHSTPKHKATEEEKKADLPKKKAILSKFRADPFTPIKDLLNAAAEEYRIKTPTKRKEYMVPQLSLIFKTANHTDIRLSWLQGLLKIKRE
ncbi:MAG: hypothetical protein QXL27_01000 [Candidatus Bathyarchaeia archaeon]